MPRLTTLQVGQVRVRYLKDALVKTRSGVVHPSVYRAESDSFGDRIQFRQYGRSVDRIEDTDRLSIVHSLRFRSPTATDDQLTAEDHRKACKALDLTPAGARARELLFSFLDDRQRRDAEVKRYFDFQLHNPYNIPEDLEKGKGVRFSTLMFRIHRGYPNGNIKMGYPKDGRFIYTVCLHPVSPYPTDDIALGQMVLIRSEPDWFIRNANITEVTSMKIKQFRAMYEKDGEPREPLVVPHRHQRGPA